MSTSTTKKIILGSDHGEFTLCSYINLTGGYELRKDLSNYMTEKLGYEVEQVGSQGEAVCGLSCKLIDSVTILTWLKLSVLG
jgi:hypothetical protein